MYSAFGVDHGDHVSKRERDTGRGAATGAGIGAGISAGYHVANAPNLKRLSRVHGKGAVAGAMAAGTAVDTGIGAGIGAAIGRKKKPNA